MFFFAPTHARAADRLRIGVTLHPYYSWVANIVGDAAEVVPVLPDEVDPHTYQPRPEELRALAGLDAIVIDGHGHDAFIRPMLEAAGRKGLRRIRPNKGVPHVHAHGHINSHTFLSITGAVHQVHNLARQLGRVDPTRASRYRRNAKSYAHRLRALQTRALRAMRDLRAPGLRMATVHDGYRDLFQELGLKVDAVIQPRHGIEPSPKALADTVRRLKKAGVHALFTERDYPQRVVSVVLAETDVRLYRLTHISKGPYAADKFEADMEGNLLSIVAAVRAYAERQN